LGSQVQGFQSMVAWLPSLWACGGSVHLGRSTWRKRPVQLMEGGKQRDRKVLGFPLLLQGHTPSGLTSH
jgi:hypothetical protein